VPGPGLVVARERRRHATFVIAGLLAAAAVTGLAFRGAHGEAGKTTPTPTPDVPSAEGKAIVFSKGFRDRAGVRTAPVRRIELVPQIEVVGTVTFDPGHVAAAGTRIRGMVRRVHHLEGDRVAAGDVLAEIESAELGEAQAQVAMLDAQTKAAEMNAKRERDLAERRLSTAREAEVAEAHLGEHRAMLAAAHQKVAALGGAAPGGPGVYLLRAPIAGTVVERHVSAGQSVEGALVAFRVADLDHLWIELAVFEGGLDAIRRGDTVQIRPMADPGRVIAGTVAHVGDAIDPTTRTAPVRVEIDNRERRIRPGQAVTASVRASGPTRTALVVPASAVTHVDGRPTVFLAEGEGRVIPTPVELGATGGADQEITAGLAEGALVVSEGVFALKSELYR
jgi:cobalt-zinc-cadmium efflux system membrane fusion protein